MQPPPATTTEARRALEAGRPSSVLAGGGGGGVGVTLPEMSDDSVSFADLLAIEKVRGFQVSHASVPSPL